METTPQQVAEALNHIASRIDATESPSSSMVKRDLNVVLSAVTWNARRNEECRRIAKQIFRLALVETSKSDPSTEALAKILWKTDAGKEVERTYDLSHRQTDEDRLVHALTQLKKDIDDFIKDLAGKPTERKELQEEIKQEEEEGDVVTSAPPMKR